MSKFAAACEHNGMRLTLVGQWQDLAAYYRGDDGNAWKYQNGSFVNCGPYLEFAANFSKRFRGQLIEMPAPVMAPRIPTYVRQWPKGSAI